MQVDGIQNLGKMPLEHAVWRWAGGAWESPEHRAHSERIVAEEGYAFRALRGMFGRRVREWSYLHLDGWSARHFASPVFGERHTFRVLHEDEEEVAVAFCPIRRDLPRLIPLQGVFWRHSGERILLPGMARSYIQEVRIWER